MLDNTAITNKLGYLIHVEHIDLNPGMAPPIRSVFFTGEGMLKEKEISRLCTLPDKYDDCLSDEVIDFIFNVVKQAYVLAIHHITFPNEPFVKCELYKDLGEAFESHYCLDLDGEKGKNLQVFTYNPDVKV